MRLKLANLILHAITELIDMLSSVQKLVGIANSNLDRIKRRLARIGLAVAVALHTQDVVSIR